MKLEELIVENSYRECFTFYSYQIGIKRIFLLLHGYHYKT